MGGCVDPRCRDHASATATADRSVLNEDAPSWQELLEPCTKGVWEREDVYRGFALFIKSTYEGQVRQQISCSER